jgi:hypothetical protein
MWQLTLDDKQPISWNLVGFDKPPPEPAERIMRKRKSGYGDQGSFINDDSGLETGDRVKILTKMFGTKYAQGREKYSYGKVVSAKGNMINVLYDEDNVEWKSHITHLTKISMIATEERTVIAAGSPRPVFEAYINGGVRVRSKWVDRECVNAGWFRGNSNNQTILPVLEMNAKLTKSAGDEPGNLLRDFWQAMVSPEWREWISAVKAEIESWDLFEAA